MEPFNKGDHIEYIGNNGFWVGSRGIVLNLSGGPLSYDKFINVEWYSGPIVDICFTGTRTNKYHEVFGAPKGIPFYPISVAELKLVQKSYDPSQEPWEENDI